MPSKKILILLAILIAGGIFFIMWSFSRQSETTYRNDQGNGLLAAITTTTINTEESDKDSDNDGLKDWEETLYNTNISKPDTDSDGTNDGKEVEMGRNPLIKGPNDKIDDSPTTSTDDQSGQEPENLTLTDQFARDFFTKYVSLQKSGVKVTPENAPTIASDYLQGASFPSIKGKVYTEKDLITVETTNDSLIQYRDSFTSLMTKNWPIGSNNEFNILQDAFVKGNPTEVKKLSTVIAKYQQIIDTSLISPTPKLATSFHLSILNNLSTYIATLKMIQMTDTDPLSGLIGIQSFQTNYAHVIASLANIRVYFINSIK